MKFTDARVDLANARASEISKKISQNVAVWDPIGEALDADQRVDVAPHAPSGEPLRGVKTFVVSNENAMRNAAGLLAKLSEISDRENAAKINDDVEARLIPRQIKKLEEEWVAIRTKIRTTFPPGVKWQAIAEFLVTQSGPAPTQAELDQDANLRAEHAGNRAAYEAASAAAAVRPPAAPPAPAPPAPAPPAPAPPAPAPSAAPRPQPRPRPRPPPAPAPDSDDDEGGQNKRKRKEKRIHERKREKIGDEQYVDEMDVEPPFTSVEPPRKPKPPPGRATTQIPKHDRRAVEALEKALDAKRKAAADVGRLKYPPDVAPPFANEIGGKRKTAKDSYRASKSDRKTTLEKSAKSAGEARNARAATAATKRGQQLIDSAVDLMRERERLRAESLAPNIKTTQAEYIRRQEAELAAELGGIVDEIVEAGAVSNLEARAAAENIDLPFGLRSMPRSTPVKSTRSAKAKATPAPKLTPAQKKRLAEEKKKSGAPRDGVRPPFSMDDEFDAAGFAKRGRPAAKPKSPARVNDHTKKRVSKTDFKRNIRLLLGGGILEEEDESKMYRDTPPEIRLNKMMLNIHELEKNKRLRLRYVSNRNFHPRLRDQIVTQPVSDIIATLARENSFSMPKYSKLSRREMDTVLAFCDVCHLDVGISSVEDMKMQLNVAKGQIESGNVNSIKQYKNLVALAAKERRITPSSALELLASL